jgi:hypothetical protein
MGRGRGGKSRILEGDLVMASLSQDRGVEEKGNINNEQP